MESLTFQLPLPDRVLSPNVRSHWAIKSKAVKAARMAAKEEARRVLSDNRMEPPRWKAATMKITVFLGPKNKQPDDDNMIASLKAYRDGLADAGIVANDKTITTQSPIFERVLRMARVELTIANDQMSGGTSAPSPSSQNLSTL